MRSKRGGGDNRSIELVQRSGRDDRRSEHFSFKSSVRMVLESMCNRVNDDGLCYESHSKTESCRYGLAYGKPKPVDPPSTESLGSVDSVTA